MDHYLRIESAIATGKTMRKPTFDVVVFGATSFVGQILCRYLLKEYGASGQGRTRNLAWAIAGRSKAKLDELVTSLGAEAKNLRILIADAADEKALEALCADTRVVVSTVGPYALYGEPLVRVCTRLGTDYCDLTGEAPWMRRMITQYLGAAEKSGARIVHCCGFDSIPSDIGVWFLQQQAMTHFGEPCTQVKMRVKAMRGAASGGTVASMLNIVREATRNPDLRKELRDPYSLCPPDAEGMPRKPRQHNTSAATFDADFKAWSAPFVMAAINVRVVLRSNAISAYHYGRDFRYDEAMLTGRGLVGGRTKAISVTAGLGGFMVAAAIPATRWLMEKFMLPAPGEGPSPEAQEKGFFDLRFVGRTADGRELRVKVTGDRDPGYGSTAKMLGEAAACLAQDISKAALGGGFWTPSTALGPALHARLEAHAGLTFSLLE
jgi:short subunit dehydrogenase-like uncharacterized protein